MGDNLSIKSEIARKSDTNTTPESIPDKIRRWVRKHPWLSGMVTYGLGAYAMAKMPALKKVLKTQIMKDRFRQPLKGQVPQYVVLN